MHKTMGHRLVAGENVAQKERRLVLGDYLVVDPLFAKFSIIPR
jgi:hypothetical protein